MLQTECKEVQTVRNVVVSKTLICDKCKKIIYKEFADSKTSIINKVLIDWYSVTTGHHDWGNDSCDSVECSDICSGCISDIFSDYIGRAHGKSNTEYIEIEHISGYYEPIEAKEGDRE